MSYDEDIKARFWGNVAIRDNDDCWLWTAALDTKKYGVLYTGKKERLQRTHRIAFAIFHNKEATEIIDCVLHSCDNPTCVNPRHLREGTLSDNAIDAIKRERGIGKVKLTPDKIVEIKQLLHKRINQKIIAKQYGVHVSTIEHISMRTSWKFVPTEEDEAWRNIEGVKNKGERSGTAKLTEVVVKEIRERYATGKFSYPDLAKWFGVSKMTICLIVNRKRWAHVV
jgi:hypothetical protein